MMKRLSRDDQIKLLAFKRRIFPERLEHVNGITRRSRQASDGACPDQRAAVGLQGAHLPPVARQRIARYAPSGTDVQRLPSYGRQQRTHGLPFLAGPIARACLDRRAVEIAISRE